MNDRRPIVNSLRTSTYTIPTDAPESDGTLRWDATTMVVVRADGEGHTGLGYTYCTPAAAALVDAVLAPIVRGADALAPTGAWELMRAAVRNLGATGIAACAIAAVDLALWDLKARILEMPLAELLGVRRKAVPIYGSGGFTSYTPDELQNQLSGWVGQGIPRVKMKVGSDPAGDPERARLAREAIGPHAELYVDANGAYERKQALSMAERFAHEARASWFEEPVSSDDRDGLRMLRDRAPSGMEIAAGEYAYRLLDFRDLLAHEAVDVLQADLTRCAGITELMRVDALCRAHCIPLSAHTAPAAHLHPCAALDKLVHIEYFHDHARIEQMLFDGVIKPEDGSLSPDLSRPGNGLQLKTTDAERFAS